MQFKTENIPIGFLLTRKIGLFAIGGYEDSEFIGTGVDRIANILNGPPTIGFFAHHENVKASHARSLTATFRNKIKGFAILMKKRTFVFTCSIDNTKRLRYTPRPVCLFFAVINVVVLASFSKAGKIKNFAVCRERGLRFPSIFGVDICT